MHPLIPRPVGSIENSSQMRLLCKRGATIYIAAGVYPRIEDVDLSGMRVFQGGTAGFIGYDERDNFGVRHYLADMSIGASYNCNYAFIRREDAEAFVEFVKTDPAVCADRKEWLEECAEWDEYLDRYEDEIDYDYDDGRYEFDREEGYR
jgi:hypothetical protein